MSRGLSAGLLRLSIAAAITALPSVAGAAPILFGPVAYTSAADIPAGFFGGGFSLEDFEDGIVNFGIVPSGSAHAVLPPSAVTDSVDGDDGALDGSGLAGWSYVGDGVPGLTFTFAGPLPTAAALVWTDGVSSADINGLDNVLFEAYGPGMVLLDSWTFKLGSGVGSYFGDTAEDRFLGVHDAGGILALRIANFNANFGQIEADHVMFGTAGRRTVPEPATLALFGLGAAVVARRFTRTRR